jgi:hypothetical protein
MTTIEFTDEELALVRSALKAFLDDFGHEELGVVRRIQAVLAKLPDATVDSPASP